MLKALSTTSVDLQLSDRWVMEMLVLDDDGYAIDEVPVVTVTSPTAVVTTPTPELIATGMYRVAVTAGTAGRYTVTAVTSYGAIAFTAFVTAVTAAAFPDVDDVEDYLGPTSTTTATMQDALNAEASNQRKVCQIPAAYPADLREALLRRVARNLELRNSPLAVLRGDAESGNLVLPGRDPEVRRLEAPYRKLVQP